jgi:hypothetical protein
MYVSDHVIAPVLVHCPTDVLCERRLARVDDGPSVPDGLFGERRLQEPSPPAVVFLWDRDPEQVLLPHPSHVLLPVCLVPLVPVKRPAMAFAELVREHHRLKGLDDVFELSPLGRLEVRVLTDHGLNRTLWQY